MSLQRLRGMMPYRVSVRRNKRFPILSATLAVSILLISVLVVGVLLMTTFNTSVVIGKSKESISSKTVIDVDAPMIGNNGVNLLFEYIKINATTTTVTTTSTTTSTLSDIVRDPSNTGVSYKDSGNDAGACGRRNG